MSRELLSSAFTYAEFGAGKGMLSLAVTRVVPRPLVLLIDRAAGGRNKVRHPRGVTTRAHDALTATLSLAARRQRSTCARIPSSSLSACALIFGICSCNACPSWPSMPRARWWPSQSTCAAWLLTCHCAVSMARCAAPRTMPPAPLLTSLTPPMPPRLSTCAAGQWRCAATTCATGRTTRASAGFMSSWCRPRPCPRRPARRRTSHASLLALQGFGAPEFALLTACSSWAVCELRTLLRIGGVSVPERSAPATPEALERELRAAAALEDLRCTAPPRAAHAARMPSQAALARQSAPLTSRCARAATARRRRHSLDASASD